MAKPIVEKGRSAAGTVSAKQKKSPARAASNLQNRARGSRPDQVSVNFSVTVPEDTSKYRRSVFLTGTLHKLDPRFPDWDPHGQEMKKVDKNHWRITLTGPADTRVEYKYTLGSWDTVEKDKGCGEIGNRAVMLTRQAELIDVEDAVQSWRDPGCS